MNGDTKSSEGRRLTLREKSCLIGYCALISCAIWITPNSVPSYTDRLVYLVDWIPAAKRMLEISAIPAKTLSWLISTFVFSPLVLAFSCSRMSVEMIETNALKTVRNGLFMAAAIITPWLLLTFYRSDMSRAGAIISGMGFSPLLLSVAGPLISLVYSTIYTSLAIVLFRWMKHRK